LERGFKEGNANEIHLPEDWPKTVGIILHFLYYNKLPPHLTIELLSSNEEVVTTLFDAYISAEIYCFEELQNSLVALTVEACKCAFFDAIFISSLTEARLEDSTMRALLLQNKAYQLASDGYTACCESDKTIADVIRGGGVDSEDILQACLALTQAPDINYKYVALTNDTSICDLYHVHHTTKKCEKANK
jgi:hypothetical protein